MRWPNKFASIIIGDYRSRCRNRKNQSIQKRRRSQNGNQLKSECFDGLIGMKCFTDATNHCLMPTMMDLAFSDMTNITDVNDHCLVQIFEKLSFSDLLNVANSCKSLNNAARLVFESRYGKRMVRINTHIGITDGSIRLFDKEIQILDFSTCLKIIRCFGASITKLAINSKIVSDRHMTNWIITSMDTVLNLILRKWIVGWVPNGGQPLMGQETWSWNVKFIPIYVFVPSFMPIDTIGKSWSLVNNLLNVIKSFCIEFILTLTVHWNIVSWYFFKQNKGKNQILK